MTLTLGGQPARQATLQLGLAAAEPTDAIRATLQALDRPLLLLTPPSVSGSDVLNGQPATSLAEGLRGLPSALADVERVVLGQLHRALLTARPLPVAEGSTLDRIAHCILEIHLARLQATRVAERWSARTTSIWACAAP